MPYKAKLVLMTIIAAAASELAGAAETDPEAAAPTSENDTDWADGAWWSKELATAEEAGLGTAFTTTDGFADLSAEEKQKLRTEAVAVYEKCEKSGGIFTSLHDCRCIAESVVEARLNPPPPKTHPAISACDPLLARGEREAYDKCRKDFAGKQMPRSMTSIVNDVADQCPSKAGAAAYAASQCNTSDASRLNPDDVASFCGCYANAFAERYMADPRSSTPNLTNIRSAAIQACADRGWRQ